MKNHHVSLANNNFGRRSSASATHGYGSYVTPSPSPRFSFGEGASYIQERMSSLFLGDDYEGIYLAIGMAATGLFVIETLIRVYRIYEANNKRRRKRRKRNADFETNETITHLDHIINSIADFPNKFYL